MARRDAEEGNPNAEKKRVHKATYARDKIKGGYLIRVQGPHAAQFAGLEVPVTRVDDSENHETLVKLIWTGTDEKTAVPIALYTFEPKPKELDDEIPF
jgi:hypothetical protein